MAITFTNMIQPAAAPAQQSVAKVNSSTSQSSQQNKFDDYLTDATTTKEPVQTQSDQPDVVKEVEEVIAAETLDEVGEVLDVELTDDAVVVEIAPEQLVPVDELMNLEDLATLLNIDIEELEAVLTQLLEQEVQLDSVWDLITLVEQQAPEVIAQLVTALQSEHAQVTPKDAAQVIKLLKVAELVGQKTDLLQPQVQQLQAVKQALEQVAVAVKPVPVETPKPAPLPFQTFQPVFAKVTVTEGKTDVPQEVNVAPQQTTQNAKPQMIQVALPQTNSSAQSEALAKEIQAIIQRQQISNQQGTLKLAIKLYPENLGTIRLELMHKDGMLTARLMASTASGKELLDAQINQLKQGLTAQNIQIDRIEITQSLQDPSRNLNNSDQHLFNNFFQRQQQDDDESEDTEEEQPSFSDFLAQMEEIEA